MTTTIVIPSSASFFITLNTSPISYSQWKGGDVVMMRWNQLGDQNPFPGRDVWHTYWVGDPGKLITTIGVSNLLIIQDGDATLVADRREEGTVKQLVELLKKKGLEKYL